MESDAGRGSRFDGPPPLATVRRLHLDDHYGSRGETPEDDWYETERLTGQITGSARSTATVAPARPSESPAVLDWRLSDSSPTPGATQTLRRAFGRRPRPVLVGHIKRGMTLLRRRRIAPSGITAAENLVASPLAESEVATSHGEPTAPALGFRHGAEIQEPLPRPSPFSRARTRIARPMRRRDANIAALGLLLAAAATLGVTDGLTGAPVRPRAVLDSALGSIPGPTDAATSLDAAVMRVERQVGAVSVLRSAAHTRPAQGAGRRRSEASHRPALRSPKVAPATAPAPTPTASTSAYTSSNSSPRAGSQSRSGQSAAASRPKQTQSTQPTFGQGGSLGPGRGAASTQ